MKRFLRGAGQRAVTPRTMLRYALVLAAVVAFAGCSSTSATASAPAPPPFTCPVLTPSASPPSDARHIRPTDVNAFLAMGDSITAAFAAKENFKLDGIREFYFARVSGRQHSPPLGASLGDQIPLEAVKIKGPPCS